MTQRRGSSSRTKVSSRIWTTSTWCPVQDELELCTQLFRRSCESSRESRFMVGNHGSGINWLGARLETRNILERIAWTAGPNVVMWRGSDVVTAEQDLTFFGDVIGTSGLRGKSSAERRTQATSVPHPYSDGCRCPIRVFCTARQIGQTSS